MRCIPYLQPEEIVQCHSFLHGVIIKDILRISKRHFLYTKVVLVVGCGVKRKFDILKSETILKVKVVRCSSVGICADFPFSVFHSACVLVTSDSLPYFLPN